MSRLQRDGRIDIIKGIGIILVVCAHTNSPFDHFICLFHMPIFFMASGYFWNTKHSESFGNLRSYTIKKVKTLWIPYAVTNAVFTLLHNVFVRSHIYEDDPAFLEMVSGRNERLTQLLSIKQICVDLVKNVLFMGQTQLGGATWFLRTLFIVVVFHAFLCWVLRNSKAKKYVFAVVIILTVVLAQLTAMEKLNFVGATVSSCFLNVFSAYLNYLMGIYVSHLDRKGDRLSIRSITDRHPVLVTLISLAILIVMNPFTTVIMKDGLVTNVLFLVICSVAGWCFLMGIATFITKLNGAPFEYIGRKTMPILEMHFLCFKVVSVLYILATGGNILLLASFPVLEGTPAMFWILYWIVGLSLPILFSFCSDRIKLYFKQRRTEE